VRHAVVAGVAALPYAKDIGMTERRAGALAILAALADAGLTAADVDGFVRSVWERTTEMEMARVLGVDNLRYFGAVDYGGGAGAPMVAQAAMAVEHGVADVVVVWRARNRGSGGRPWAAQLLAEGQDQFERPHGLVRPVDGMAIFARHWMHRYGWSREDLGRVAVLQRAHAQGNPAALMRDRPMTMDDYLGARMIADPLCLFDCCLETDGALALVLTTADRAAGLGASHDPVHISGYAWGSGSETYAMTSFYGSDLGTTPAKAVADELWRRTGLTAGDIDVAQLYDGFTPQVLVQLHEYGFCDEGQGPAYLGSDGAVGVNTSGGGLSEAYVHGFNLLVEGVRQVRGDAPNPVPDVRHCLVTSGNVVPTGAVVFSREPQ
jgi:acetyl-CoA acetyltransferase